MERLIVSKKLICVFLIFSTIFCGICSPILSEDDCFNVKYIHEDSMTRDTTCVEEGVFGIPQNCQDYYRCDEGLKDYYETCPSGQQFNGTACDEGNKDECPQKLCSIVYENSDLSSTMSSSDVNATSETSDADVGDKTTESILTTIAAENAKSAKQTNTGVLSTSKNILMIPLIAFCNLL